MAKPGYWVTKDKTRLKIRFVFISKGNQDVIKIIDYDYIGSYNNIKTFNLGFGDYELITEQIDDYSNTDNGDVYDVLNTVLILSLYSLKNTPHILSWLKEVIVEKNSSKDVKQIVRRTVKQMVYVKINIEE